MLSCVVRVCMALVLVSATVVLGARRSFQARTGLAPEGLLSGLNVGKLSAWRKSRGAAA